MKYLILLFISTIFSAGVSAHSGGTDSQNCHTAQTTGRYHCHTKEENGIDAWDVNVGYQYDLNDYDIVPYIGASVGQSENEGSTNVGADFGIKTRFGLYAGYVTTSKSFQIGYKFVHISLNDNMVGLGLRFPFHSRKDEDHSSIYASGSFLGNID